MRGKSILISLLVILIVGSGVIFGLQYFKPDPITVVVTESQTKSVIHENKNYRTVATVAGIGDILIHDWVYNDAKTADGYDFNPMFENVHEILQKPDFLIANQESMPGGEELGISSYPLFNSPYEIVDALMNAGVDMVTTANNHMLDRREQGILNSIAYYEKVGLPYTGTFKSPEDKEKIRVMNVNGIKIAVLAYSYGTNGIPIPKGKDYLVSLIDVEQIIKDINRAKEQSDFVLLAMHWGDEYRRYPNQTQKNLAKQLIEAGADIIFGHHPHVLQPIEWIEKPDGKKGFVIYSLGNFLSGQIWDYKDIGGMIELTLEKRVENNETFSDIIDVQFYPTFSSSIRFKTYRVYPLDVANEKGFTKSTSEEIIDFLFSYEKND